MIWLTVFKIMTDEIRQDIEDAGSHLKPWYVVSLNKILKRLNDYTHVIKMMLRPKLKIYFFNVL